MIRAIGIMTVIAVILTIACGTTIADESLKLDVKEFRLDNGMTFLVVPRATAPVFSGYICVEAGSAYEKIGNIGTAHLLEHMMFKGSQSVGTTDYKAERKLMALEDSVWAEIDAANQQTRYIKLNNPDQLEAHIKEISRLRLALDSLSELSSKYVIQNEFDEIYTRNGSAQFNATTMYDFTAYFVSLPSNRLELWFSMESDRLKYPAWREFFPERDVVSEERRLSVENNPDSKLYEQLIGTAFIAHPYQIYWEWQSEENNLTRSDMQEFFDNYYTPQNLTAAIVGDVDLETVRELAEKYFGDIPARELVEPIYTREPLQQGERRVDQVYEANPVLFIGYHKTAFDDPDEAAFHVVERLLTDGRTSRLYKALVLEKQLCIDIDSDVFPGNSLGDLQGGLFNIYACPKDGVSTIEVEEAIYYELDRLAQEGISDRELEKVKNNIDADFIWSTYSNLGLARNLAHANGLADDWRYLNRFRDMMKNVISEDIMRITTRYLIKENRTVATLIPTEKGGKQ